MTVTPWGRSDELRARRLPPGPGTPGAEVEANQRERLYGAAVAAVAEHGYEATRVADLLEISGVSRNAFYTLFENKQDCVVATIEQLIELGGATLSHVYDRDDLPWEERLRLVFDGMVDLIQAQPAAAHLCLVDAHAVGPEAIDRVDEIGVRIAATVNQALRDSPERAGMPHDLVWAILGGLRKVIHTRLLQGEESELRELAPQLLDWALSYRNPSQPLRRPRAAPSLPPPLKPADGKTPRERILIAVTDLVAEKGYAAVTIGDVAQQAAISLSTFYAEFEGKEDAILAALRRSARLTVEAVLPAYQAAPDWPHAVGEALHAFLGYLANRPAQVKIGLETYRGGPQTILRRDELLTGAQGFLAEGYRLHPDTSPVAGEAIGAGINELLYKELADSGVSKLYGIAPAATFIALAPFVGVEQAASIANGA